MPHNVGLPVLPCHAIILADEGAFLYTLIAAARDVATGFLLDTISLIENIDSFSLLYARI